MCDCIKGPTIPFKESMGPVLLPFSLPLIKRSLKEVPGSTSFSIIGKHNGESNFMEDPPWFKMKIY